MGSAMIGTVIWRASTTDTTGGGGTRSASIRDEQPAIVTEAEAIPSTSPTRVPGLVSLRSNMFALLHEAGLGEACGPTTSVESPRAGTTVSTATPPPHTVANRL